MLKIFITEHVIHSCILYTRVLQLFVIKWLKMPEICLTEAYGLDSISCAFFYLEPTLSEHEMVRMQRAALHCYACAVMAMEK